MKDNISDILTRIRNGQKAGLLEIPLYWPTPKFGLFLLKIFQREGFIRGIKHVVIGNKEYTYVLLKYTDQNIPVISKITRVSTPGKRIYSSSNAFWKISNGKGMFVISTPKGLVTDHQARMLGLGGEIICYIN